jgi:hypothetical protein
MNRIVVVLSSILLASLALDPAAAQQKQRNASAVTNSTETGLASMHSWVRVGRKTCMADHEHSSSGNGPTRAAAEKSAIVAWASFTDLEYGDAWANWTLSVAKRVTCDNVAGQWKCDIESRPCRPF